MKKALNVLRVWESKCSRIFGDLKECVLNVFEGVFDEVREDKSSFGI